MLNWVKEYIKMNCLIDSGVKWLQKANKFSGALKSSEEGKVFCLDRKYIDGANLIWNMRELLEIFETDQYSEFFFKYKNGKHEPGKLLG